MWPYLSSSSEACLAASPPTLFLPFAPVISRHPTHTLSQSLKNEAPMDNLLRSSIIFSILRFSYPENEKKSSLKKMLNSPSFISHLSQQNLSKTLTSPLSPPPKTPLSSLSLKLFSQTKTTCKSLSTCHLPIPSSKNHLH